MSVRDVIAKALRDNTRVQMSLHCTDAILAALEAAGYAVVPKEPTAEMIAALRVSAPLGVQIAYKEMLKAAKETP